MLDSADSLDVARKPTGRPSPTGAELESAPVERRRAECTESTVVDATSHLARASPSAAVRANRDSG